MGQGGFGTVIKVYVKKTKVVAIKKVRACQTGMKEIRILMSLHHPSIVGFIDHYQYFDTTTKGVAIVVEFCPGSLKDLMNTSLVKCKSIKVLRRYEWNMQLALGLQFIHNRDIIHRDLKPDNILITNDYSLKIADVGLAKAAWDGILSDSPSDSFCNYLSSIVGTRTLHGTRGVARALHRIL